jgi:hypothetical protein
MERAVRLTRLERLAIEDLHALSRRWPSSLKLFSWSGHLHVLKLKAGRTYGEADVTTVDGIPNDGGDPDRLDVVNE